MICQETMYYPNWRLNNSQSLTDIIWEVLQIVLISCLWMLGEQAAAVFITQGLGSRLHVAGFASDHNGINVYVPKLFRLMEAPGFLG